MLSFLEKAGFIHDQYAIAFAQVSHDILAQYLAAASASHCASSTRCCRVQCPLANPFRELPAILSLNQTQQALPVTDGCLGSERLNRPASLSHNASNSRSHAFPTVCRLSVRRASHLSLAVQCLPGQLRNQLTKPLLALPKIDRSAREDDGLSSS